MNQDQKNLIKDFLKDHTLEEWRLVIEGCNLVSYTYIKPGSLSQHEYELLFDLKNAVSDATIKLIAGKMFQTLIDYINTYNIIIKPKISQT